MQPSNLLTTRVSRLSRSDTAATWRVRGESKAVDERCSWLAVRGVALLGEPPVRSLIRTAASVFPACTRTHGRRRSRPNPKWAPHRRTSSWPPGSYWPPCQPAFARVPPRVVGHPLLRIPELLPPRPTRLDIGAGTLALLFAIGADSRRRRAAGRACVTDGGIYAKASLLCCRRPGVLATLGEKSPAGRYVELLDRDGASC